MSNSPESQQSFQKPRTWLGNVEDVAGLLLVAGSGAIAMMPPSGRGPGDKWELLGKALSVTATLGVGASLLHSGRIERERNSIPIENQR